MVYAKIAADFGKYGLVYGVKLLKYVIKQGLDVVKSEVSSYCYRKISTFV